ncbi:hypothetical protein J2X61_006433 [Bacillus sp. 3255]|nr:hypothetical protein [Bacillus sp. 3255]
MIKLQMSHVRMHHFFKSFKRKDSDKKREVDGSIANMIESLNHFGIVNDEGPTTLKYESGEYGPTGG